MAIATLVQKAHERWTQLPDSRSPLRRLDLSCRLSRPALPHSVPVPGIARGIHVKIASTPLEWEEAFQLVTDNYQARGYEPAGARAVRFSSYHALPDTAVLVAKAGERVVATLSMVLDNTLVGLPMESLYGAEIQELRRKGRRLCEVGSLADRDLSPREFIQVFVALIQLAWQHLLAQGGTTGVIAVNPRHSGFYTKVLGFTILGPRRSYCKVQGHPAEAFFAEPDLMRAKVPAMHERIFGQRLPTLQRAPMPTTLVRDLAARSTQTHPLLVDEILQYVEAFGSPRRW
jgi:hypothetical protein